MERYAVAIVVGIAAGFLGRLLTLRIDYRFYPTYPHAYMTHLALGFIAAGLGAVAIPAIAKPDYVAVTFLALAAQQFRDIRSMERDTLNKLEESKMIPRGPDYIEGIARVFEARNYLAIFTAMLSSAVAYWLAWEYAIVAAFFCMLISAKLMGGSCIGEIAKLEKGKISFDGSILKVNDVIIMNVGLTLDAPGQRMAIIHDVVSILGSKVDMAESELQPLARKHSDKGYLALFLVANEPDLEYLMEIIKKVPVIESTRGTALKSFFGRKAAD